MVLHLALLVPLLVLRFIKMHAHVHNLSYEKKHPFYVFFLLIFALFPSDLQVISGLTSCPSAAAEALSSSLEVITLHSILVFCTIRRSRL